MQRNYGRGQWHDRKPAVSIHRPGFIYNYMKMRALCMICLSEKQSERKSKERLQSLILTLLHQTYLRSNVTCQIYIKFM